MIPVLYTAHVLLAGVWLGGMVFTTFVVSPALEAMKWPGAERVRVRGRIGARYAKVGIVNLILLAVFAVLDGFVGGFGALSYAEYALLVVLFGLVTAHGAYFGRRLRDLAEAEIGAGSPEEAASLADRRRGLQGLSLKVSRVGLVVSAAVVVLAANGRGL